jgi:hypothetical protein
VAKVRRTYASRPGARFSNTKARRYGSYLNKLSKKSKNRLTPKDIVDDAKKKDSPLHDYFEWDDSLAAQQYRIEQARHLLNHIEVTIVYKDVVGDIQETERQRQFISVQIGTSRNDRVYMPFEIVAKDELLLDSVVSEASNALQSWINRYEKFTRLGRVVEAVEKAKKLLTKVRK